MVNVIISAASNSANEKPFEDGGIILLSQRRQNEPNAG
jgi:hypothetical protein